MASSLQVDINAQPAMGVDGPVTETRQAQASDWHRAEKVEPERGRWEGYSLDILTMFLDS